MDQRVPRVHTHYANLKVARDAPIEVIRAAFKSLSMKYHPDRNPGKAKAARIMAVINTSYEVLSDPVMKRQHDDWIRGAESPSDAATTPAATASPSYVPPQSTASTPKRDNITGAGSSGNGILAFAFIIAAIICF